MDLKISMCMWIFSEIDWKSERADATLNGGTLPPRENPDSSAGGLRDPSLTLHAEKVQLEYPEGLQSEINYELTLTGAWRHTSLEGNVAIVSALISR